MQPLALVQMYVPFLDLLMFLLTHVYVLQRFDEARTHFSSVFANPSPLEVDALDEWLSSPPIPTVLDPIKYWVGMKAAGHPLASMALDYLSIPGAYPYPTHIRSVLIIVLPSSYINGCRVCILAWWAHGVEAATLPHG